MGGASGQEMVSVQRKAALCRLVELRAAVGGARAGEGGGWREIVFFLFFFTFTAGDVLRTTGLRATLRDRQEERQSKTEAASQAAGLRDRQTDLYRQVSPSDFIAGDLRAAPVRTPAPRDLIVHWCSAAASTAAEMMTAAHIVPGAGR